MMKKIVTTCMFLCCVAFAAQAQRFALIDMEYILERIPAYEQANRQLESASRQWQSEVEAVTNEAKSLYENYQNKAQSLSAAQRKAQEEAIVEKEKQAGDLRKRYFGPEGELYKQRQELMAPIENRIYEAVKTIATQKGYSMVWDRASGTNIIFASPSIDISDEVLTKLGYSN